MSEQTFGVADEISDEDLQAAEGLKLDPAVKQSYEAALERGANQQGEGKLP